MLDYSIFSNPIDEKTTVLPARRTKGGGGGRGGMRYLGSQTLFVSQFPPFVGPERGKKIGKYRENGENRNTKKKGPRGPYDA